MKKKCLKTLKKPHLPQELEHQYRVEKMDLEHRCLG